VVKLFCPTVFKSRSRIVVHSACIMRPAVPFFDRFSTYWNAILPSQKTTDRLPGPTQRTGPPSFGHFYIRHAWRVRWRSKSPNVAAEHTVRRF